MPSGAQDLADAFLLTHGRWRCLRLHELGKTENRIQRAAQLMAHARQKVRLGQIGLLRQRAGSFQLHVLGFQHTIQAFAFGHIARCCEHTLQVAVAVIKSSGVVGDHGFPAVPCAGGELVVGDRLFIQYQRDARLGPLGVGEIFFERCADQFITRAVGERLHLLVDVGDDAHRVGGHDGIDICLDQ